MEAKTTYKYPKLKIYCIESGSYIDSEPVGDNRFKATYDFPPNNTIEKMVYHFELYADDMATGLLTTVTVHPREDTTVSLTPSNIVSYPTDISPDGGPSSFFIHLKVAE